MYIYIKVINEQESRLLKKHPTENHKPTRGKERKKREKRKREWGRGREKERKGENGKGRIMKVLKKRLITERFI